MIRGEKNSFRKFLESELMCKLFLRGENSKNDGKILKFLDLINLF